MRIQCIDNLKERLSLCWAHISQHRVAKDIQAFTKRLKAELHEQHFRQQAAAARRATAEQRAAGGCRWTGGGPLGSAGQRSATPMGLPGGWPILLTSH